MRISILSLIISFFIATGTYAQVSLPYSEDFTGQNGKGATGDDNGTITDTSAVNWTIDVGTTLETDGTTNKFVVENEKFRGEDVDGSAFWFSPIIDVTSLSNIDVSAALDILGDGANSSGENITVSFTLNPSDSSPIFNDIESFDQTNDSGLPTAVNGSNIDVSSANELQIRVEINANGSGDGFTFDDVSVAEATIKAEPENHVTSFNATASSPFQIDLSWTDATGSPEPENYLIKVNTGSITPPSDGTEEADDTDLSDGTGALNVAQGTESAIFTSLEPETTYNFEIYPYTNAGSTIDYKTDGTVPIASATTTAAPDIVINEILADPDASTGDANGDGTVETSDDEFVEIVNTGSGELDISGWIIADGTGDRFTFPDPTVLQPNQPAVVFGGGTPAGYFGGSLIFTATLGLNNSGDDIILKNASGANIASVTYGSEGGNNQSLTRDPDLTGSFIQHTTLPESLSFSPGTRNDGTNFGNFLNLDGAEGFRLLSIPISSTNFADLLDPLWTQGIATGADVTNGDPNVFIWDHTGSSADSSNFTAVSNLTNTPEAGSGFLTFVFSDDDFDGTSEGFPKTLSLSGSENSGPVSPTVNQNANGFTLLGNPFASTIDFDDLTFGDPADFTGVVYVWNSNDGTSGTWDTWDTDGQTGDLTGGLIAPFQGFFIENAASGGTPSVTIEEADKTTGGTFRGKTAPSLGVRLELKGKGLTNSAWLSFTDNGSLSERVRGDALKLASLSDRFIQLGTTKPGSSELLDINHLPALPDQTVEIPLEITGSVSGSFSLETTDFRVPDGMSLRFNNLATGKSGLMGPYFATTIELTGDQQAKSLAETLISAPEKLRQTATSAAYSITIEPGVATSVDEPDALPQQVELAQNFPNPFNPTTNIQFALPSSERVSLEVYDVLGRRVAELINNEVRSAGNHTISFDASRLSSGVYIYQLRTASGNTITKKLTLIK